jgi:hypothetical protein
MIPLEGILTVILGKGILLKLFNIVNLLFWVSRKWFINFLCLRDYTYSIFK